jgi:putative spermidine/putrescine transport system ATP-binding protein
VAEFVGENNRLAGMIVATGEDCCTVETDTGLVIRSQPQPGLEVGDAVFVYLRPERVQVGSAAANCENKYVVEVADAIFLGDHTRLRIDLPGNPNFTVKQNFFGDARPPRPSDRIEFGWTAQAPQVVVA